MRAVIQDWYTDIFLSGDEVKEHCKPGMGADTCSWLLVGSQGFECSYKHKSLAVIKRRDAGKMVAMRDGCDKVKEFVPSDHGMGEVEF